MKHAFKPGQTAFIPFVMAGHPTLEKSKQAIMELACLGASIIEVGVPFSDPVADGVVNQRAAEVALSQGVRLCDVLHMIQDVRRAGCQTPILLFSYLNPILAMGYDNFIAQAKTRGVDGVLVVDLPPEEGMTFYQNLHQAGLAFALLASPTTDVKRLPFYQALNPSFVYYISRLAVTGVQDAVSSSLAEEVAQLREHLPKAHIAVGFGIADAAQAAQVAKIADGVVIGSVLVNALEQSASRESFKHLVKTFTDSLVLT